jgi:uncharacterized YccA/Bax inhibitor family protein
MWYNFIMFDANPTIKRISSHVSAGRLTYDGVVHRTGALLLITVCSFAFSWNGLRDGSVPVGAGMAGLLGGFILGLIIIFTRATNPFLIGAYAVCEGVMLGIISYLTDLKYPGIPLQAVVGTVGCFLTVLALYGYGVLRATPVFVKTILVAMVGICLLYLTDLVCGMFGSPLGFLHGSSLVSIGISAVIVIVASLSFVIDFAAIEEAIGRGVDERFGWHLAFSLLVGLVWLYLEILSLLIKLRNRD